MSLIPDCRNDADYNQKYLNDKDKEFVRGFDWCAEEAVDNLFDNLEYIEDDYIIKLLEKEVPEYDQNEYEWEPSFCAYGEEIKDEKRKVRTVADYLRMILIYWIEAERDQLITSMIDNMDDDEYEAIRNKVDGGDSK